jgi:hypothetical protein
MTMKTSIVRNLFFILVVLLFAGAVSTFPSFGRPDLRTKNRKAKTPDVEAAKPQAGKGDTDEGSRQNAVRSAKVNFRELARKSANELIVQNQEEFVPERESDEAIGDMPVPPGVKHSAASITAPLALPQPLGPSPGLSSSFQGSAYTGSYPPDSQGAVGPNHLLTAANGGLLVQTRAGTAVNSVRSLAAFFSDVMNGSTDVFDPRTLYDPYNDRWIVVAVADRRSAASAIVVAVSQSSDPTGSWFLYRFDVDSTDQSWSDFPSVGFNRNWIGVNVNMFPNSGSTPAVFDKVLVIDKAGAYAGTGAGTSFTSSAVGGTLVPATTYDNSLDTLYFLQHWNGPSGVIRLYSVTGTPSAPVMNNLTNGIFISTNSTWSFEPSSDDFAPQRESVERINLNDARMQSVVYRNGSLWAAQTAFLPAGGPKRSAVQWWQVDPATSSVQQFGRIDNQSGIFYAFPSIAVNKNNDVLLGYGRFSNSQFAGSGYAFRSGSDPINSMRDDTVLKTGTATYLKRDADGRNRWGDYSSAQVDPVNDSDFWTTQEYVASQNVWATWWGRVVPPAPSGCNFTISPDVQNFTTGGGSGVISVATSAGCAWSAVSSDTSFITVNAGTSGNGSGTVTYSVSANSGTPRSGYITIAGIRFNVSQDGAAPTNDNFANAQLITGSSGTVTGSTIGATREAGEPAHARDAGGASIWFKWQAPESVPTTFSTFASSFDTTLGIYTGSDVGSLTPVLSNDDQDYPNILTSSVSFSATAGKTYFIAVDGFAGANGSVILRWGIPGSICAVSISSKSQSVGSGGGAFTFGVTTGIGCPWSAVSNSPFITITGGASGSGNGTVSYAVAPSPGNGRTGFITIAGQTFTVNQAGVTPTVITSAASAVTSSSASISGTVNPNGRVSRAWFEYGTASDLSSYTPTVLQSVGSDTAAIAITAPISGLSPYTTYFFRAAATNDQGTARGSILSFTTSGCSYSLSAGAQNFSTTGGTGTFNVVTTSSCTWTAVSNNTGFITVTGGASGAGNGTVSFGVPANSGVQRSGTITVGGQSFTVNQDGTSGQSAAVSFTSSAFTGSEAATYAVVNVQRSGDTSGTSTVSYATSDSVSLTRCEVFNGFASSRCDYTGVTGTLTFSAAETSKTIVIPIIDDSFAEGNESFGITLTGAAGAALGTAAATVTIQDNEAANGVNPVDNKAFFTRQQYLDFLGREPDTGGMSFYLNILNGCVPSDLECNKYTRGALSANFFRSPEFQRKGSYVMYLYMVSLGQRPATSAELNDPAKIDRPHYNEFITDLASISDPTDDPAVGEAKKVAFTDAWMRRAEIQARYPSTLTNAQFVQKLMDTAGITTLSIQNQLVSNLNAETITRAQALRAIAESAEVNARFYKQAFVTMEYFGYLRRDPEVCVGSADPNGCGYIFHNNRFQLAADPDFLENTIVRGFIESPEYRGRFGP